MTSEDVTEENKALKELDDTCYELKEDNIFESDGDVVVDKNETFKYEIVDLPNLKDENKKYSIYDTNDKDENINDDYDTIEYLDDKEYKKFNYICISKKSTDSLDLVKNIRCVPEDNIYIKKAFEIISDNIQESYLQGNFSMGHIWEDSYFKLNNRRENSRLLLPGRKSVMENNNAKYDQKMVTVFVDFSESTTKFNGLLNGLCMKLKKYGKVYLYNNDLIISDKNKKGEWEHPVASFAGTDFYTAYNHSNYVGKDIDYVYVITDGFDDSIERFAKYKIKKLIVFQYSEELIFYKKYFDCKVVDSEKYVI